MAKTNTLIATSRQEALRGSRKAVPTKKHQGLTSFVKNFGASYLANQERKAAIKFKKEENKAQRAHERDIAKLRRKAEDDPRDYKLRLLQTGKSVFKYKGDKLTNWVNSQMKDAYTQRELDPFPALRESVYPTQVENEEEEPAPKGAGLFETFLKSPRQQKAAQSAARIVAPAIPGPAGPLLNVLGRLKIPQRDPAPGASALPAPGGSGLPAPLGAPPPPPPLPDNAPLSAEEALKQMAAEGYDISQLVNE